MSGNVWRLFWGTTYAIAPNHNGVSRFVQQLQRITFKFCKTGGSSLGTRQYIEQELIHYARANPSVVVYLKPRRHRTPSIMAEYLNGEREHFNLRNRSTDDIIRWVDYLSCRSGEPVSKLLKAYHTDLPSVQGTWTPWTHMHPDIYKLEYPFEETRVADQWEKTATDELLEMAARIKASPQ